MKENEEYVSIWGTDNCILKTRRLCILQVQHYAGISLLLKIYIFVTQHVQVIHASMKLANHDDMILVLFAECPDKGKCFHAHAKIKCNYRVLLANLSCCFSRSLEEFSYCVVCCYRPVYRRVVDDCALFVWRLACSRYEAPKCRHGLFPTTTNHPTEDPKTVLFHSLFPLRIIISLWCECRTTEHGWSSPIVDVQCWQWHGCISSEISLPWPSRCG